MCSIWNKTAFVTPGKGSLICETKLIFLILRAMAAKPDEDPPEEDASTLQFGKGKLTSSVHEPGAANYCDWD